MIKVDCAVCGMPLDPSDLKPHKCLSKENPMKPHKHAEIIKAWADGAEIEYKEDTFGTWLPVCQWTTWDYTTEYRIKPEPKPDVVTMLCKKGHSWYELYPTGCFESMKGWELRIKLTFDGETGEPKSAEVLK